MRDSQWLSRLFSTELSPFHVPNMLAEAPVPGCPERWSRQHVQHVPRLLHTAVRHYIRRAPTTPL